MDINLKVASKEHSEMGWVLDYNQLNDIKKKLEKIEPSIDLEEIEAVLLASVNKEHLIKS